MPGIPDHCPSCSEQMLVTELSCPSCGTTVTGRFEASPLAHLPTDDLSFVLLFVLTKGNLKEMERELGISYWTIRRKLDEVVERLGQVRQGSSDDPSGRSSYLVLRRLKDGELDVEQALELLRASNQAGHSPERKEQ